MIDPSAKFILRSKFTSRRFFLLLSVLLLLSLLLQLLSSLYVADALIKELCQNTFGNFSASILIIIITYAFYMYVTSPELRDAEIIPLRSAEISEKMVIIAENTSDYWFWGRSGNYFRTKVLPELNRIARDKKHHITVRIVLPDPSYSENNKKYMHIKKELGEEATLQTLSEQVLATVTLALAMSSRNSYLHVQIALVKSVPVLRYDMSNLWAIITRDAKNLPAILVNGGNPYHEMFKDAVENELSQGNTVNRTISDYINEGEELEPGNLKTINGVPDFSPEIIAAAKELLSKKVKSRYER